MTPEILLVEESPTQAEELRTVLEEGGYTVRVATSGGQALAAARRNAPALVVSDVMIPDMDGYTFCARIKSDPTLKGIPVVLVTAFYQPEDVVKALECGVDSLIRRPFDGSVLLSRLAQIQANVELRKTQRAQMGMEVRVAGRRYFISSDRQQILDLLIGTYEDAVLLNQDLAARQQELERSARILRALHGIAEGLNEATTEQDVAETALARALELPGVQAGWIVLREGETGFRLVAARGLPQALAAPGAMEGDCLCRRQLRAGELRQATNIIQCERLQRAPGDTGGLRYHASVPLWLGDRTIGVMNLSSQAPGLFRDDDLGVLSGVGHQVAIALERARLRGRLEEDVLRGTAALEAEVVERRRAEELQRRLIAILEATSDFVGMSDPDGGVVYLNQAARRMLGIGAEEDLRHIRIPDTHPQWAKEIVLGEAIPTAVREGVWSGETALLSRDGREIPVSQVMIAHKTPDGRVEYLSTIARDLTERKRVEVTQRQTEKLAAMGELLAGVAHELNNPLTAVLGRASLLGALAPSGPLAAHAEKLIQAAERCGRIVKNFLALARQYPPERHAVRLNQLVQEALELLAYQLRVDTVEVALDLASDLPVLWADPHLLQQVIVNLISNAHHALRESPRPRRLTLTTRPSPSRTHVRMEVTDTGPGIPPEIQSRIFEPFFTTKPVGQGTGLGLSLCLGIVEGHGGTMGVESGPGRGARFWVELPVGAPPREVSGQQAADSVSPVREKSILVADDEAEVAQLLAEILAVDGHRVDWAADGLAALERVRARDYDLIASDIRMPHLDGSGLYRELERHHPQLLGRFVFVTGDVLSAETKALLEETSVPSLSKPFTAEEVLRLVRQVLLANERTQS